MKPYTKNYLKATGYTIADFIPCEVCGVQAVDIHHIIHRSQGGTDNYDNLIALCRVCHQKVHDSGKVSQEQLLSIVSKREI